MVALHPYHPLSLPLPLYVPPVWTTIQIFVIFFALVGTVIVSSYLLIRNRQNNKALFMWFVFCAFIHSYVEGWYVYHYKEIAGQSNWLSDGWKEYSHSDSRYLAGDSFVVVMETITAISWGPLSVLVAYYIYKSHPARHILAFLISTGQLYGDVLYYGTALFEGARHTSPHPLYFWAYFVGLNAPWIIIPLIIMWSSAKDIIKCVSIAEGSNKNKKTK